MGGKNWGKNQISNFTHPDRAAQLTQLYHWVNLHDFMIHVLFSFMQYNCPEWVLVFAPPLLNLTYTRMLPAIINSLWHKWHFNIDMTMKLKFSYVYIVNIHLKSTDLTFSMQRLFIILLRCGRHDERIRTRAKYYCRTRASCRPLACVKYWSLRNTAQHSKRKRRVSCWHWPTTCAHDMIWIHT